MRSTVCTRAQNDCCSDLGISTWQLLPFSRGNVTIKVRHTQNLTIQNTTDLFLSPFQSSDPFTKPAVNVNYFGVDWDLDIQIAGARVSRKILSTSPLAYVYCSASV